MAFRLPHFLSLTPLINAHRKVRLQKFEHKKISMLSSAKLDFKISCGCARCDVQSATSWRLMETYNGENRNSLLSWIKPVAAAIDLNLYPSFEDYRRAVSKETNGKYHRSANRARRLGYSTRRMGIGSFGRDHYAIRASKLNRSKGIVWEAVVGPRDDLTNVENQYTPPVCSEHWQIDWGAFKSDDQGIRLVGFASLLRAGNQLQVLHMIGHGEALADGVTKLLMFEIMNWLLDRTESCIKGLDYFIHGTIEEGSDGLVEWKRYMKFQPMRIGCDKRPSLRAPAYFDPALYLELNPDVACAKVDPYTHYLLHGMLENRKISNGIPP